MAKQADEHQDTPGATSDRLVALARLLARQAVREVLRGQAPALGNACSDEQE